MNLKEYGAIFRACRSVLASNTNPKLLLLENRVWFTDTKGMYYLYVGVPCSNTGVRSFSYQAKKMFSGDSVDVELELLKEVSEELGIPFPALDKAKETEKIKKAVADEEKRLSEKRKKKISEKKELREIQRKRAGEDLVVIKRELSEKHYHRMMR